MAPPAFAHRAIGGSPQEQQQDVPIQNRPAVAQMPPGTSAELCVNGPEMQKHHTSVTQLWEEYCGEGAFEGKPIDGGFRQLESSLKGSWRRSYNQAAKIRFSKLKRIIDSVQKKIDAGQDQQLVLEEYDTIWTSEANNNASKMIVALQNRGDLSARKRKRRNNDHNEVLHVPI